MWRSIARGMRKPPTRKTKCAPQLVRTFRLIRSSPVGSTSPPSTDLVLTLSLMVISVLRTHRTALAERHDGRTTACLVAPDPRWTEDAENGEHIRKRGRITKCHAGSFPYFALSPP